MLLQGAVEPVRTAAHSTRSQQVSPLPRQLSSDNNAIEIHEKHKIHEKHARTALHKELAPRTA